MNVYRKKQKSEMKYDQRYDNAEIIAGLPIINRRPSYISSNLKKKRKARIESNNIQINIFN
jgi:myo-inositol-1-phosphate synthase